MIAPAERPGADAVGWVLSTMQPADLPEVLAIEQRSFPRPWTGALFLQELRVTFSRVVLVRGASDGTILGYLCRWLVADEVHILNVAVHPDHRRRGIATWVVGATLREAEATGAEAVTLEVRRANAAGRRLYERLRFEEVGVRRDYYGKGEDAVVMRRSLRRG